LSKELFYKYKLKKAAFEKRYGFFDDTVQYLIEFEKEITAVDRKSLASDKLRKEYKKLEYKINRDLARLYALKKDKRHAE
jgi:hypothetical protein